MPWSLDQKALRCGMQYATTTQSLRQRCVASAVKWGASTTHSAAYNAATHTAMDFFVPHTASLTDSLRCTMTLYCAACRSVVRCEQ